jgi:glycosyltransferase 2 family protein
VLTRLAANRWLRAGLLVAVLSLCGYGLYVEWPAVTTQLARLHWYVVAVSLAAAIAGNICMMLAWRAILADLGSPLGVAAAARVNFLAQLGKYVPGAVWALAAQVELGNDLRVPRRRGAASVVVSLTVTVGTGLTVAAVFLPLASPATARHYWPVLAVIPVLAVCLCPPVLRWLLDHALALFRMPPLEQPLTASGLVKAMAFNYLGWLLLGTQVWLLTANLTGRGAGILLLATGGYALAFSAGLLLVVFPGGIGARELVLIAALTTAVPHGAAVAIALVTRVVATVCDLACGAVGLALNRAAKAGVNLVPAPSPAPAAAQELGGDRAAL